MNIYFFDRTYSARDARGVRAECACTAAELKLASLRAVKVYAQPTYEVRLG